MTSIAATSAGLLIEPTALLLDWRLFFSAMRNPVALPSLGDLS
jgi:hypothetical protein